MISDALKKSILKQIAEVESNILRLRILVEADLADVPNTNVAMYYLEKSRLQIENLEHEISELAVTPALNKNIKLKYISKTK